MTVTPSRRVRSDAVDELSRLGRVEEGHVLDGNAGEEATPDRPNHPLTGQGEEGCPKEAEDGPGDENEEDIERHKVRLSLLEE